MPKQMAIHQGATLSEAQKLKPMKRKETQDAMPEKTAQTNISVSST
jgi:hypothetical protein